MNGRFVVSNAAKAAEKRCFDSYSSVSHAVECITSHTHNNTGDKPARPVRPRSINV